MEQAYGGQWPKAEHYPDPYLVPALDPIHASHFQSRSPISFEQQLNTTFVTTVHCHSCDDVLNFPGKLVCYFLNFITSMKYWAD